MNLPEKVLSDADIADVFHEEGWHFGPEENGAYSTEYIPVGRKLEALILKRLRTQPQEAAR